jgi:hypothetical protein
MFASLSILGLYEYNEGIFDNLELPTGIDATILIPEICTECSDFALLYPDYEFMRMLIGVWSKKEKRIWEDLLSSENFEYNPIENYDRYEEITRTVESESSGSSESSGTNSGTASGTNTAAQTAFNSDTFKDTNRSTASSTESGTNSSSDSAEQSSSGNEHVTNHMHGNIGVTTAQQMIAGYREISDFTVYNYIVESFKRRFCVQIY